MTSRRRYSSPSASLVGFLAAILVVPAGCNSPNGGGPVGSDTNWLRTCRDTADCGGDGNCVCGTCSLECATDAECTGVPGARCAGISENGVRSQCQSDVPALAGGLCLATCEPGSCGVRRACVAGTCVVHDRPTIELCDSLAEQSATMLAAQDELLALIQALRTAGGVTCDGGTPSVPILELRWDARLACAAQALAADMAVTRSRSLIDSAGRGTVDRLALTGYSPRLWGEAFALSGGGASAALDAMLTDSDSCARFVDAAFDEVGIATVGDAYVVTIASE